MTRLLFYNHQNKKLVELGSWGSMKHS